MPRPVCLLVFLLLLLLPRGPGALADPTGPDPQAAPQERTTYVLEKGVMSCGGREAFGFDPVTSAMGTLGQPMPLGPGSNASYALYPGFWQEVCIATDVPEELGPPPFRNALFQNVPNPFNPVTAIRYEVAEPVPVEVAIFDVQGRVVRTLVREVQSAGPHEVVWDGRDDGGASVGSGVYLYRLRIGDYGSVKKMVLLK